MSAYRGLLEDVAKQQDWVLNEDTEGGFIIGMPTTEVRTQSVHIEVREDAEGAAVAVIWSEVAEASKFADPWQLLDFNWNNLYGSLARRGPAVVLVHHQLLESAEVDEIGRALAQLGKTADAIEEEIYGELDLN